jgi:AcrR family transcriptional regulator
VSDKKVHSLTRVLEVAAGLFCSRKYADVSISEISASAHCSTSTIYAVFGNKENLFLEAILYLNRTRVRSAARFSTSPSSFNLFRFAEMRIRSLATPQRRGAMRAISAQPELARPLLDRIPHPRCGYDPAALDGEISACVKAGYLRAVKPHIIAYHIVAVTAYEPVVLGLLYGEEPAIDVAEVLRNVFIPLVTPEGERLLEAFIAAEIGQPIGGDGYEPELSKAASAGRR